MFQAFVGMHVSIAPDLIGFQVGIRAVKSLPDGKLIDQGKPVGNGALAQVGKADHLGPEFPRDPQHGFQQVPGGGLAKRIVDDKSPCCVLCAASSHDAVPAVTHQSGNQYKAGDE